MPKRKDQRSRSHLEYRAQNALELAGRELDGNKYSNNGNSDDSNYSKRRGILMVAEGDVEDEGQESFEDEELDSDEALGSDDAYDIMSSKFSRRNNQESEEKSDGEYTSVDEADLLPLSEVWDMEDGGDDNDSSSAVEEYDGGKLELQKDSENDDNNSDSHDTDDNESESFDDSSSKDDPFDEIPEDDDDDELTLNNVASSLMRDGDGKVEYKRLGGYGAGKENEFALPSVAAPIGSDSGDKLTLADMIDVIDDKEAAAKATLVQGNSSTLSVPLPQRIQQRHERKVAYAISNDEMNKWKDVVQENRRAEHLDLSNHSLSTNIPSSSVFVRSIERPQTHLEQHVEKILQDNHLADPEDNSSFRELSTAQMSVKDMKRRTRETKLMRELMFREERKARRLKKIKSKTYRRIKKKEMLKNRDLAGIDQEFNEDADLARAKERMTLKHRSNSKWAKDMVKHGMTNDAETREEVEEMLRQGERLKSKILDHDSEEEDNRNLSDIEREEEEGDIAREKIGKSGIMNMSFMKAGEAREKEENRRMIEQLRVAELSGGLEEENVNEKTENVELNQGRRIYKSIALSENVKEEQTKKPDDGVNSEKQLKVVDGRVEIRHEEAEPSQREDHTEAKPEAEPERVNPWLVDDQDGNGAVKHSSKVSVIDKNSTKAAKNLYKLEKKEGIRNSKDIDVDEDSLLDDDDQNHLKLQTEEVSPHFMFKQQEVIAEAFAGDDVVGNFDAEKRKVVDEEDDKEEDVTLLGWGQWVGAGYKPKKRKKVVKMTKGVASRNKRKDKNLPNVIINEKLNKKNLKYQSSAVPFPFENKEQYERSLRMPLGSEWTSSSSHQKMIKPRILTKPSEVIDPLKAPFK